MSHDHHAEHTHEEHDHSHGPGHSHAPKNFGAAFAIGVTLNFGFVVLEVVAESVVIRGRPLVFLDDVAAVDNKGLAVDVA